jgi:hypothetical protein
MAVSHAPEAFAVAGKKMLSAKNRRHERGLEGLPRDKSAGKLGSPRGAASVVGQRKEAHASSAAGRRL